MSSDFEDDARDGADQPYTLASLRRTNDEMRTHIRQLKAELEQERNNSKRAHREKVTAVKMARDEEQERSQQARDELRRKLTSEHKEHTRQLQEALGREYENQTRTLIRQREEQLQKAKQQWEQEKAEAVRNARNQASSATRKELEEHFDADKKGLIQELFELNQVKAAAEMRAKDLQSADRSKAEEIRRLRDEHQNELAKFRRQSQQEHRRQIEEIHEKEELLTQKERELINAKRKKSQVEMEKEQLEETLARTREGESWQRMSPLRAVLPGIGDGNVTSPQFMKQYNDKEKQLILRNSELSNLARRLKEQNTALENENAELSQRVQGAELANSPLEEKNKDLMKKYNRLIAKFRRLEDQNKHTMEENQQVRAKHSQLMNELDQMTRKARRYSGTSKMAEQQKEELELLRLQTQEQMKSISELKQQMVEKSRRIELLQATKKNLLKEREEAQAMSQPLTPTSQSSAQMLSLERVRAWDQESIASTVQEEVDQALFERDEMETDFRQLQKEHLHLQRVFALRHYNQPSQQQQHQQQQQQQDDVDLTNTEVSQLIEELQQEKEALSSSNDLIANELELAWKVNEERIEKITELEQELVQAQKETDSLQQQLQLLETQEQQKHLSGSLEQIEEGDEHGLDTLNEQQEEDERGLDTLNKQQEGDEHGLDTLNEQQEGAGAGEPLNDINGGPENFKEAGFTEEARLKHELLQLQESHELLQQQMAEAEQEFRTEVANAEQEAGQHKADLQLVTEQLQATLDENAQLQERIQNLQLVKEEEGQLLEEVGGRCANLQETVEELESKCASLEQQVETFEAADSERQEQHTDVEEQLQRLTQQLEESKSVEIAQIVKQHQSDLEEKEAHYERLQEDHQEQATRMEQEKSNLQQILEMISEEKEELSHQLEQLKLQRKEEGVDAQTMVALQNEVETLREVAQRAEFVLSPSNELLTNLAKPVEQMLQEQQVLQQCILSLQRAAKAGRIPDLREHLEKLVSHIPTVPVRLASLVDEMEAMFGQPITPLRAALTAGELSQGLSSSEDEDIDNEAPPLPSSPPPSEEDSRRRISAQRMSAPNGQFDDSAGGGENGEEHASAALSALAIVQDMLKGKEEQLKENEELLNEKVAENDHYTRQVNQLEQDLAVANAQCQQMQQRLDANQRQVADNQHAVHQVKQLEQDLAMAHAQCQQMQQRLENNQRQVADNQHAVHQVKQLEQDLAVADAKCQQMQQHLETKQVQLLELQTASMKLDTLQQVHNDLQIEHADLQQQLHMRRQSATKSSVQTTSSEELQQLQDKLTDAKHLLQDQSKELNQAQRERDSLSQTNEALNSELLLLWRLVSLELRLTKKTGQKGSNQLEQRVRELELQLKDHREVESKVAEAMERASRGAGPSSLSSLSDWHSHSRMESLENQLESLSKECKSKEEFISHLQAEVARLTKTLSGNILDDMSSIHEEESVVNGNDAQVLASSRRPFSPVLGNYGTRRRTSNTLVHGGHAASVRAELFQSGGTRTAEHFMSGGTRTHGPSPLQSPRTYGGSPRHRQYLSTSSYPAQTLERLQERRASIPHDSLPPEGRLYVTLFDYEPSLIADVIDVDSQLCVMAGNVVVVYGGLDSQGMYHAEYQGQHGLIPASFLEEISTVDPLTKARLTGSIKAGVSSSMASSRASSRASLATTNAADGAAVLSGTSLIPQHAPVQPSASLSSQLSSSRVQYSQTPDHEDGQLARPAAPSHIHIKRQLEDNLLVAWHCPPLKDGCYSNGVLVAGYQIAVDEHVEILQGAQRSKVLVENVDLSCAHRVSVCTLAVDGQCSDEVSLRIPDQPSAPPHQPVGLDGRVAGSPHPPTHSAKPQYAMLNAYTSKSKLTPTDTHIIHPKHEASPHRQNMAAHPTVNEAQRGSNSISPLPSCGQPTGSRSLLSDDSLATSPDQLRGRCDGQQNTTSTHRQRDSELANLEQECGHLAVALYDYSARDSHGNGALSFQQGELLQVLADESSQNFVTVSANGVQGKVPRSFVAEMSADDGPLLLPDLDLRSPADDELSTPHAGCALPWPAKALYDYQPEMMSPRDNARNTELSFKRGDLMTILREEDKNGYFLAECNGCRGLVPASFIESTIEEHTAQAVKPDHHVSGCDLSIISSVSSYTSSDVATMPSNESQAAASRSAGHGEVEAPAGGSQHLERKPSCPVDLQQPEYLQNGLESEEDREAVSPESPKHTETAKKGLLNRGRGLLSILRSRRN